MIIEFNQGANATAVLGDDFGQLGGNRISVALEQLNGHCLAETVPMADAPYQLNLPHQNISGQFIFTATQSFASRTDAMNYCLEQYALLGVQDLLTLVWDGAQWYFLGAILRSIERLPRPGSDGVKLGLRYTFVAGQISQTQNAL